jgi:hypothetical protein
MSAYNETTAAIRGKREGADSWELSDALLAAVPQGESREGFAAVIRAAESEGVRAYGADTLRIYRDTAARWPKATRIPGVSFTAHRAALLAPDPAAILADLANARGAENVSVGDVRAEIAALRPTPTAAPTAPAPGIADADADALAVALAAQWNAEGEGMFADLGRAPAAVALIGEMVAAFDKSAKAKARKSAQWNATPSPVTPTAAPSPDGKKILGNVRA